MKWQDFDYKKWKEDDSKYDHKQNDNDFNIAWESSTDLEEVMKKLFELRKGKTDPPSKPNAYYNDGGDILHITLSDDDYYGHWLCPSVTVLLSQETNEVVGVEIWGLQHILDQEQIKLVKKEDAP